MTIINNDTKKRSWFVYNEKDTAQIIALASGPIDPNGGRKDWDAPKNSNGLYTVLFKRNAGGGSIVGTAIGTNDNTFTFDGKTVTVS
jgi:hypothetical protein